jgi:hypothetical protein
MNRNIDYINIIISLTILIFIYAVAILMPGIITARNSILLAVILTLFGSYMPILFSYFFIIFIMTYKTLSFWWFIPGYLDYTVLLTPFFLAIIQLIRTRRKPNVIVIWIGIFILYIVINGMLTDKPLLIIIREVIFLGSSLMLFVYYYFNSKFNVNHYLRLKNIVISLVLVQFIFQLFEINDIPRDFFNHPDSYSGSMGTAGTGVLGDYCLVVAFYFLVQYVRSNSNKKVYLIFILIVSIQAILGESKFFIYAFISFPIYVAVLYYNKSFTFTARRIMKLGIISLITLSSLILIYSQIADRFNFSWGVEELFNTEKISKLSLERTYTSSGKQYLSRGESLILAINSINTDYKNAIIGNGIGVGKQNQSNTLKLSNELTGALFTDVFYGLDLLIIQLGWMGIAIFIALLMLLYKQYTVIMRSQMNNQSVILYTDLFLSFILVYILAAQYSGGWLSNQPFNPVFWVLSAGLFSPNGSARQHN